MDKIKFALYNLVQGSNYLIEKLNGQEKYDLDWKDVIKQYKDIGADDLEEFSANYTFGYHCIHNKLEDEESKLAMNIEIYDKISFLQKEGFI